MCLLFIRRRMSSIYVKPRKKKNNNFYYPRMLYWNRLTTSYNQNLVCNLENKIQFYPAHVWELMQLHYCIPIILLNIYAPPPPPPLSVLNWKPRGCRVKPSRKMYNNEKSSYAMLNKYTNKVIMVLCHRLCHIIP